MPRVFRWERGLAGAGSGGKRVVVETHGTA